MKLCGAIVLGIVVLGIGKFWKKKIFFLLLAGSLLCFVSAFLLEREERTLTSIEKNEVGDGSSERELTASVGEEELSISVKIPEKTYSSSQVKKILEEESQKLKERILGENASLDKIEHDLTLPNSGENEKVSVDWYSGNSQILSWDGKIGETVKEEGEKVSLTAVLSLQDTEQSVTLEMTVYPRALSGNLKEDLQEALDQENKENTDDLYYLPGELDGQSVVWRERAENTPVILAALILVFGILLVLSEKQKADEKRKVRKEELKKEYPEFISRLLLMLYAGTSMRKALFEMARQYQREKKKKRKEIFEELLITCREIERGVTEESAYENLADRCELADYRTLSVLFVQNQKRGGAGIMKNLEDEVLMAFGERKRQARIAADAASLKLLIPLGLMLLIAFALMMIPAFLSI